MDPQLSKSGKISGVWTPSLSLGGRCGRFLLILKCSTFPYGEWLTPRIISLTIIVTPDFSSDLERAPGAGSIADEKSGVTIMVNEIWKV